MRRVMIVDVINRSGVVELESALIVRSDEERFYLLVNGYQRSVRIEDLDSGKYRMIAHRTTLETEE